MRESTWGALSPYEYNRRYPEAFWRGRDDAAEHHRAVEAGEREEGDHPEHPYPLENGHELREWQAYNVGWNTHLPPATVTGIPRSQSGRRPGAQAVRRDTET